MAINNSHEYFPPKKGMFAWKKEIIKRLSYLVWKRKLIRCGVNSEAQLDILDAGCGPGFLLKSLNNWFPNANIYGGDINKFYASNSKHISDSNVVVFNSENLPFKNFVFDVIFSLQVVEHLHKPREFFQACSEMIKPNGYLIISTPNPACISSKILGDDWQGIKEDHISLKYPNEWRIILRKMGFTIISDGTTGLSGIKFMRLFPFNLIDRIPLFLFGFFPWMRGESYMAIAKNMRQDVL